MKKIILFLFLLAPVCGFSYNWTLYSPDSIHANDVYFNAFGHDVICTNLGLCINDGPSYTWVNYNYNMPVLDAIPFPDSTDVLLCMMGNGSYSDGLYSFNMNTHVYHVVEWVPFATFVRYNSANDTYYAGSRYNGLYTSTDGLNWDTIPYFNSRGCADIDFFENHIAAIQENNIFATFYSHDGGVNWAQSTSTTPLHDLAYRSSGKLYGVFTGMSNSSGLYSSSDYGETWDLEQYEDDINVVGFDVVGNIFTGWHSSTYSTGVAIYDTSAYSFTFYNNGLGNTDINRFCINIILSSITIFVCTDSGVFYCNDYLSSIQQHTQPLTESVNVFPNPSSGNVSLSISPDIELKDAEMELYNAAGDRVLSKHINAYENTIPLNGIKPGIYYYSVRNKYGKISSGKLAVQ